MDDRKLNQPITGVCFQWRSAAVKVAHRTEKKRKKENIRTYLTRIMHKSGLKPIQQVSSITPTLASATLSYQRSGLCKWPINKGL